MAEFASNGEPRSVTKISSLSSDDIELLAGQSGQSRLLDLVLRGDENNDLLLLADHNGRARLLSLTYERDLLCLLLQRILREADHTLEHQILEALNRVAKELERKNEAGQ